MRVSKKLYKQAAVVHEWTEFYETQASRVEKNLQTQGQPLLAQIGETGLAMLHAGMCMTAALPATVSHIRFVKTAKQELGVTSSWSAEEVMGRVVMNNTLSLPTGETTTPEQLAKKIVIAPEAKS